MTLGYNERPFYNSSATYTVSTAETALIYSETLPFDERPKIQQVLSECFLSSIKLDKDSGGVYRLFCVPYKLD